MATENDQYQLPFPFRKRSQDWPNKSIQARMRLQGLKKRFIKGEKFFEDYRNLMEDLLQKGYAEKSPKLSNFNKWYIPHHGVYHSAKPEKVRVVFDCSVEYLGYALNKQLIQDQVSLTRELVC